MCRCLWVRGSPIRCEQTHSACHPLLQRCPIGHNHLLPTGNWALLSCCPKTPVESNLASLPPPHASKSAPECLHRLQLTLPTCACWAHHDLESAACIMYPQDPAEESCSGRLSCEGHSVYLGFDFIRDSPSISTTRSSLKNRRPKESVLRLSEFPLWDGRWLVGSRS
jgi:hypothetical protein